MEKFPYGWLFGVLIMGLIFRLLLFAYVGDFSLDSYYHIRLIEEIKQDFIPNFHDELSYGGRFFIFPPVYQYVVAIVMSIPGMGGQLVSVHHLMAALLAIIAFFIGQNLGGTQAGVLSAAAVFLVPGMIMVNLIEVTPLTLAIFFLFCQIYLLFKSHKQIHALKFILLSILFPLTSPISLISIPVFGLYFLYLHLLGGEPRPGEYELVGFAVFLTVLENLLVYYRPLAMNGISSLFGQVPAELTSVSHLSLLSAVNAIGLPFIIAGGLMLRYYIQNGYFARQTAGILAILSTSLIMLLFPRMLAPEACLGILGVCLAILSGPFLIQIWNYVERTKFYQYSWKVAIIAGVCIVSAGVIQCLLVLPQLHPISSDEKVMFEYLRDFVAEGAVVLAPVEYGHAISGIGKKGNVADAQYIGIAEPEKIIEDITSVYGTESELQAVRIMDKYKASHLIVSEFIPKFITDRCFRKLFQSKELILYQRRCSIIESPSH